MVDRPAHITRAIACLRTYTALSMIATGDFGQVVGHVGRLERRIDQLERQLAIARGPSPLRRLRQRLSHLHLHLNHFRS